MMKIMFICLSFLLISQIPSQNKRPIDTEAYYRWKTISDEHISDPGNWVTYLEKSYRGNDKLVLLENGKPKKSWERVKNFHADPAEQFVVFQQTLDYDSIRQLKIKKVKKKKWPADSLGIFIARTDSTLWLKEVESFETGEGGTIILISHHEAFKLPKEETEEKPRKCFLFKRKKPEELEGESELEGNVLSILDAKNPKNIIQVENVKHSSLNEKGGYFAYIQSFYEDTILKEALYAGMTGVGEQKFATEGEITNLTWSNGGNYLAFNLSMDTTKAKQQQLFIYDYHRDTVFMIADTTNEKFKPYQCASSSSMTFNKEESKLFFQVGVKPIEEAEDTIPDDEKAILDVWSWTDGQIQPQQLKSAKKDALGLVDYVYDISSDKIVQLQDTSAQSLKYQKDRIGNYALLSDQTPYLKEMTWDFWYYDLFRVDLNTGEKMPLLKHVFGWDYSLSPMGTKFTYWNVEDSCWYMMDLNSDKVLNLTKGINDKFYAKEHDVPSKIAAQGNVHWFENEQSCAIESQNELWIIPILGGSSHDLTIGKPYKITKGKEKNESYKLMKFDEDQMYFSMIEGFYLKSFNHRTKSEGIYHFGFNGLTKLGEWDAKLMTMTQSEIGGNILIEKMSFTESYNLFLGDEELGKLKQITDINPQQSEYKWGTVELVNWKDYNGDSVSGLLYKPEDFDPAKSYPMIVYFYELYTDDMHFYYRPKPTASIIYPTEYVSNDYVVFIPDIRYEIGHPAKSAYNAIMSGTDAMLKLYPNIDSTRMGLQGQSWGGYQTAQMVTMTDRYKCAMAGAPVSNMFSAYGGVRWGSGLSRTFQYETGQSRIGATIWEKPELYIENSPLFHLPNVETPLLIMHNDGDGAVPWYQGIELYQGLRRLQKPVWMLNYNEDEHNLMKDANRMDLSIRMREFFDHYLLGEPAPNWLEEGIPAVDKGKD